jgi:heterodisulfide reductase subunit C
MSTHPHISSCGAIDLRHADHNFRKKIQEMTGSDLNRCLHCSACGGGCPFSKEMDPKPNGLIRMIQLGLRKEALECPTIWMCVGCYTCSGQCPMGINIAGVMDAVRQLALAEKADIADPAVYEFHNEIRRSIKRYGRTHKLEVMMRYKLARLDFFSDAGVGLKMIFKRKLELLPSRVKRMDAIKGVFKLSK